jgi:hypothetical protein
MPTAGWHRRYLYTKGVAYTRCLLRCSTLHPVTIPGILRAFQLMGVRASVQTNFQEYCYVCFFMTALVGDSTIGMLDALYMAAGIVVQSSGRKLLPRYVG